MDLYSLRCRWLQTHCLLPDSWGRVEGGRRRAFPSLDWGVLSCSQKIHSLPHRHATFPGKRKSWLCPSKRTICGSAKWKVLSPRSTENPAQGHKALGARNKQPRPCDAAASRALWNGFPVNTWVFSQKYTNLKRVLFWGVVTSSSAFGNRSGQARENGRSNPSRLRARQTPQKVLFYNRSRLCFVLVLLSFPTPPLPLLHPLTPHPTPQFFCNESSSPSFWATVAKKEKATRSHIDKPSYEQPFFH